MIGLTLEEMSTVSLDKLGEALLADLSTVSGPNERDYLYAFREHFDDAEANALLAEALGWLFNRGLLVRTPDLSGSVEITRAGFSFLQDDPVALNSIEQLNALHPSIEQVSRSSFLGGKFQEAIFAAMLAIEVRVTSLANLDKPLVGVDLMNHAFNDAGPLCDTEAHSSENAGIRSLFAGTFAAFRNPNAHRHIDYSDSRETMELLMLCSLLMRILDSTSERMMST